VGVEASPEIEVDPDVDQRVCVNALRHWMINKLEGTARAARRHREFVKPPI
jgi:hypothetical protein